MELEEQQQQDRPPSYAQSVEQPTPIILTIYRLSSISPSPIDPNKARKIGRHVQTLQEAILLSASTTWVDFGFEQIRHVADLFNYHETLDMDTALSWSIVLRGPNRDKVVHEGNWENVKKLLIASREELVMMKKPELILVVGPVVEQKGLVKKAMGKALRLKRKVWRNPWLV